MKVYWIAGCETANMIGLFLGFVTNMKYGINKPS
jgi:hypothetical protein